MRPVANHPGSLLPEYGHAPETNTRLPRHVAMERHGILATVGEESSASLWDVIQQREDHFQ